ncbi:MAG TPA: hypothetical protein DDW65_02150, partial [Firmicutes bacterium]|nr:hypothetical protein [Bacillota bacterium]
QVVPGGVVVDLYYPIISSQVTRLKTRTPVQLYVKYEYKDGKGQSYSDEIAEHLEFLGINQFLWSNLRDEERSDDWIDHFNNAPFVAAFVTRMDDAVKQFAGFISEAAGGAAASQSDDEALKWLQAAYNLMLENNIVYQTPSGFLTTEQATVQEIKFPRDVFRDKSGTCIDLAITYAALAESVGLNSWLLIIPEHCLPIIGLPSGKVVPVETTGLGGGTNRANFEVAIRAGSERLNQAAQKPHKLLDIRDLLSNEGIQNPELPPLTTDFFCGIKRTLTGTTQVETPTSTTEKPSGKETVLFADDFSNRNTGWFEENTSSDKYSYNNGRFELTIYKKNWWCGASAPPVIAANSYTVQTDMVDYGNSTYGIIFNISDWDQPFYYFIVNSQTQLFAVEKRFLEDNEVKWETIIGATKSNYINASGVNRLKVHQEGDTVSLYINGNFLISAKIQSYNSNIKVGLCAQTGDDVPATASFDNFLITAVATK